MLTLCALALTWLGTEARRAFHRDRYRSLYRELQRRGITDKGGDL